MEKKLNKKQIEKSNNIFSRFKSFVDECSNNEIIFNQIVSSIAQSISSNDNKEDLPSLKRIIETYNRASIEEKKEILNIFVQAIIEEGIYIETQYKKYECSINGHSFTKWKHSLIKTAEPDVWHGTLYQDLWERHCKNCYVYEKTHDNPRTLSSTK